MPLKAKMVETVRQLAESNIWPGIGMISKSNPMTPDEILFSGLTRLSKPPACREAVGSVAAPLTVTLGYPSKAPQRTINPGNYPRRLRVP